MRQNDESANNQLNLTNVSGTTIGLVERLPPLQLPLVNKFYKSHKARGKAKSNEQVWVVKNNGQIVGAARVADICGHDFLTGVQVAAQYRRQGIATVLIGAIVSARQKSVYTFPYAHLVGFYAELGFVEVVEADLPNPIKLRFERYRGQGRDIVAMVIKEKASHHFYAPAKMK